MTDFAKDVDFRGNKIKRAKVEILNRNTIANDDVIDKEYVDDVDVYNSSLTANTLLQPTNEITDRTLLHNKPTKEVLDNLFYPRVLHSYLKPVLNVTISYVNPGTAVVTTATPGKLVDVIIATTVDFKDSQGLVNYEFSGNGMTGEITQTSASYTISNYVILESQSWTVKLNHLAANTLNDSRGELDNVGAVGALKYGEGSVTTNVTNTFPIPYFKLSVLGDIPFPSSNSLEALLASGKVITTRPNEFTVDVPSGNTYSTFIAFEITGNVAPNIVVVKDNAQSMSESFTSTVLFNVPFGVINKTFAVYRSTNGIGYSKNSTYNIKLS